MTKPDVSVIVISFNDAGRLAKAIRSIQRQTLRALEIIVVDDCSTDDTENVVARIAAGDSRVRYERLPANSGGCSAPRNRGMELAKAPWIMFCDSDDEYERHACKNLLEAAERTGADIVCGTAERVDVRTGRTRRWRPELHDRERVVDALADLPELIYDTICVNKIYRTDLLRSAGLRFPEGLLFEDQLFTLEAMASARRLAVIAPTVYRWSVDRLSEEPSITQRRNEVRNVESRVEVNRRIDAFLASRGDERLRVEKDLKFLRHDLYLYLSSILEADDQTALALVDRLEPYVSGMDLTGVHQLRPALRVAVYHLLLRDVPGIRSAMRFVKWASVVDVPVIVDGEGQAWGCEHYAEGPIVAGQGAREWLDISALDIASIPLSQRRYLHRLESLEVRGSRVVATGSTVDYDGRVGDADTLELRFLAGGSRTLISAPGAWTGHEGVRRTWRVDGVVRAHPSRVLNEGDRGTIAVAMAIDGRINVTGVRSPVGAVPQVGMRYPGKVRRTGPDTLAVTAPDSGAVGWAAVMATAGHRRAAELRRRWLRLPGATRLATLVALVRRDGLTSVAARIGRALPRRATVLVDPGLGRTPDPDVSQTAAAAARIRPDLTQVWVARPEWTTVPAHATRIERGSVGHAWHAARALVRIEDGSDVPAQRAVAGQMVLNAHVDVPVSRLGRDDPEVLTSRAAAGLRRRARGWGALATSTAEAAEVVSQALAFSGRTVPVGLPRLDDPLRHAGDPGSATLMREALDLPADRAVVLHIPMERNLDEPLLDLAEWGNVLGQRTYLVLAPALWESVPTSQRSFVRLLTPEDDVERFLVAADLVVSDYSPLLADAAVADRPIVLFQPDRDLYLRRTRGLYEGVDELGPVTLTQAELQEAVLSWLADAAAWDARHGPSRRQWAARWGGPADGHAGRRLAESILLGGAVDG